MEIMTELQDRILRIEIKRPAKKNALTIPMYAAMADALATSVANTPRSRKPERCPQPCARRRSTRR
jgi:enoyl-CoA hydratase/carnithine racemase